MWSQLLIGLLFSSNAFAANIGGLDEDVRRTPTTTDTADKITIEENTIKGKSILALATTTVDSKNTDTGAVDILINTIVTTKEDPNTIANIVTSTYTPPSTVTMTAGQTSTSTTGVVKITVTPSSGLSDQKTITVTESPTTSEVSLWWTPETSTTSTAQSASNKPYTTTSTFYSNGLLATTQAIMTPSILNLEGRLTIYLSVIPTNSLQAADTSGGNLVVLPKYLFTKSLMMVFITGVLVVDII